MYFDTHSHSVDFAPHVRIWEPSENFVYDLTLLLDDRGTTALSLSWGELAELSELIADTLSARLAAIATQVGTKVVRVPENGVTED